MSYSHSPKIRSVAAALMLMAGVDQTNAASLSERRAAKEEVKSVEVEVACGKLNKENCDVVIPAINERTASQGVRLVPLESKGSVESMKGLCDNDVQIAIVQADVYSQISNSASCTGKLTVVGSGLYPYLGFMISRATQDDDKFGKIVDHLKEGTALHIAAGGSGSGGEATLRNVLASNAVWKQTVDIQPDNADTALNKLQDGQLDLFFVMDGSKSQLLDKVRDTVDTKTHKPIFKFVDFAPDEKLLNQTLSNGMPLYATAAATPGWFATKTIATPAVIAVSNAYYQANAEVVNKVRAAAEDALPVVASKAGAPADWRNAFALRPH